MRSFRSRRLFIFAMSVGLFFFTSFSSAGTVPNGYTWTNLAPTGTISTSTFPVSATVSWAPGTIEVGSIRNTSIVSVAKGYTITTSPVSTSASGPSTTGTWGANYDDPLPPSGTIFTITFQGYDSKGQLIQGCTTTTSFTVK